MQLVARQPIDLTIRQLSPYESLCPDNAYSMIYFYQQTVYSARN